MSRCEVSLSDEKQDIFISIRFVGVFYSLHSHRCSCFDGQGKGHQRGDYTSITRLEVEFIHTGTKEMSILAFQIVVMDACVPCIHKLQN
jgi:hypothetical protein